MNKQELIKEFKKIGIYNLNIFGSEIEGIPTKSAIALIEQLDEPEEVKVPQFVAQYIKEARECSWDLQDLLKYINEEDSKELQRWFYHECNQEMLAKAWIFGYEVEKEKRYIVTLKSSGQKLYYHTEDEDYIFSSYDGVFYSEYHTKTDLEENDMSWVFNCPGLDVEEVKE